MVQPTSCSSCICGPFRMMFCANRFCNMGSTESSALNSGTQAPQAPAATNYPILGLGRFWIEWLYDYLCQFIFTFCRTFSIWEVFHKFQTMSLHIIYPFGFIYCVACWICIVIINDFSTKVFLDDCVSCDSPIPVNFIGI